MAQEKFVLFGLDPGGCQCWGKVSRGEHLLGIHRTEEELQLPVQISETCPRERYVRVIGQITKGKPMPPSSVPFSLMSVFPTLQAC